MKLQKVYARAEACLLTLLPYVAFLRFSSRQLQSTGRNNDQRHLDNLARDKGQRALLQRQAHPIPKNNASHAQPNAKIIASPEISAPISDNPASRDPPSRELAIFAPRSTSHPVTNAATGYENKYPAVGPAKRASPGSPSG